MTREEVENVRQTFKALYDIMMADGHVTDPELIKRGYPRDRNENGEEVDRNATIGSEYMQRAKILNHPNQVAQRRKLKEERMAVEVTRLEVLQKKTKLWITDNILCELKLVETNLKDHPPSDLTDATTYASAIASFTSDKQFGNRKTTTKLLTGFVCVREFNVDGTIPKD
jgi:hypothetical protein